MSKRIVVTGAVFVCLSIVLGAMGAHMLEDKLSADLLEAFEKGARYQMYTGLGLLAVGLNEDKFNFKLVAFYALSLIGVLLFSGGLYLYSMHESAPFLKTMAMIVPFGGTAMILSWFVFIVQLARRQR
jgi:uncharacterized membrane protein YgdD (TMEM256/DUF423 family)